MPTIRDVAFHAQVSTSTVSHVINGTRFVDPATKERVQATIRLLGYQPNSLARSLRRGTTNTIALIVPDNSNAFFADLARAIEDAGFAAGYSVILCNSDGSQEKEAAYIDRLLSKQMDGFILISSGQTEEPLHMIIQAKVPVVVVDREVGGLQVDQVLSDNDQGGYLVGRYLTSLGHRQVGCITGLPDLQVTIDRLAGFRRALREVQAELSIHAMVSGDFRYTSGQSAMSELLKRNLQLTAVFAMNDLMALAALRTLQDARIRVPEDISIIGFDNITLSNLVSPTITTIAQPVKEIGQTCVDLLLQRIQQEEPGTESLRIVLPTTLVTRESCAPLPGKEVVTEV